jgi:gas vesicle protein
MSKLPGLMIGLGAGALLGAALVMLFAPATGEKLQRNLRRGFDESMAEAREISRRRRAELEAELAGRR